MRNRWDVYHERGNKASAYKLEAKCGSPGEVALKILRESIHYNASLQVLFYRTLDFGNRSLIDASIRNLPRLIISRRGDKQTGDSRLASKKSAKLAVVERVNHGVRDTAPAPST